MIKKKIKKFELDPQPLSDENFLIVTTWTKTPTSDVDRLFWSQRDWNQTLITKINNASANIHKKSFSAGADTIKLSNPEFLFDLEYFIYADPNSDMLGTLANRYKVYLDPETPEDEIWVSRESFTSDYIHTTRDDGFPEIRFLGRQMDKKYLRVKIKINE